MEITAVNMTDLILYDKLDGCICRNQHLANCVTTVLTSMDFEVFIKTDEVETYIEFGASDRQSTRA